MAAQRGFEIYSKMFGNYFLPDDVIQQEYVDSTPLLDLVQPAPYLFSMTLQVSNTLAKPCSFLTLSNQGDSKSPQHVGCLLFTSGMPLFKRVE